MNAVFKACVLASLIVALAVPAVAYADNMSPPQYQSPMFSFLSGTTYVGNDTVVYNPQTVTITPDTVQAIMGADASTNQVFYGYDDDFRTRIMIAGTSAEFRLMMGANNAPDSAEAWSWSSGYNGVVVIKSPSMLPEFKQALTHQMALIAERTRLKEYTSLPDWYLDGVASYTAGDLTTEQTSLVGWMANGSWMSLGDLEAYYDNMTVVNEDDTGHVNARAGAAVFVSYLGKLYGIGALVSVIDNYTMTGDLNQSFINSTGLRPDQLYANFKSSFTGTLPTSNGEKDKGTINGYLLYDDSRPIGGVNITFSGSTMTASVKSDPTGHYSVDLTPGTYDVALQGSMKLYDPGHVAINAGVIVPLNLTVATAQSGSSTPVPTDASSSLSSAASPGQDDTLLPLLAIAVTAASVFVLLAIFRRNWH